MNAMREAGSFVSKYFTGQTTGTGHHALPPKKTCSVCEAIFCLMAFVESITIYFRATSLQLVKMIKFLAQVCYDVFS